MRRPAPALSILKELSLVVASDDIPAAVSVYPGLTSICRPVVRMAANVMRTLLRHLGGDKELPQLT